MSDKIKVVLIDAKILGARAIEKVEEVYLQGIYIGLRTRTKIMKIFEGLVHFMLIM